METEERKPDGPKEENHPLGENAKLSPTNPNAPPTELAMPELPKVEYPGSCGPRRGTQRIDG